MLAYFVGVEHLFCALRDGADREHNVRLGRLSDLLPRLELLLEAIESLCSSRRTEQVFTDFAHDWGSLLLPDAALLDTADVLIIIPHSILHGVPLHAIEPHHDLRPLALTHGIVYIPSGSQFVRCVERNPIREFDLTQWQFPPINRGRAPPAPETCWAAGVDVKSQATPDYRRLADLFSESFRERKSIGGDRRRVKDALARDPGACCCIVCHGHYDSRFPMFSGLLLDSVRGGWFQWSVELRSGRRLLFRDLPFRFFPPEVSVRSDCVPEILTVNELMVGASINAELVALIGCSTAVGQTSSGDDFLSLANQFLKIGAASVLASMWALDLDFASSWVPRFLRCWLKLRMPKALAMRESMREELSLKSVPVSQWAVPVLLGDWL